MSENQTRAAEPGQTAGHQSGPVVRWLDQDAPLPGTTASRPKAPRLSPQTLPLLAIILLVGVLVQERLAGKEKLGSVPEQFVGGWRATTGPYRDRGFTISSDSLWLRLGPDVSIGYPMLGVRERRIGDGVVYTFVYGDRPEVLEMDLQMNPDLTVNLANTPSVRWRREGP